MVLHRMVRNCVENMKIDSFSIVPLHIFIIQRYITSTHIGIFLNVFCQNSYMTIIHILNFQSWQKKKKMIQ